MYRYSAQKYNDLLAVMGIVRIGTLHDFRRSEHKRGIADPSEGKKTVSHSIDHLHIADSNDPELEANKDYQALGAFNIADFKNCTNVSISNVSVEKQFDHPDCFVFCTSAFSSPATMAEFEGADTCRLIKDPHAFYSVLTSVLNSISPVVFRGWHDVIYQDRDESWNGRDWGHHPALIKDPSFRSQGEIRAIWQPKLNQPIKPLVLGHHCLGQYCEDMRLKPAKKRNNALKRQA